MLRLQAYAQVNKRFWEVAADWPEHVDLSIRVANPAWPEPVPTICVVMAGHNDPHPPENHICKLLPTLAMCNPGAAAASEGSVRWHRVEPARGMDAVNGMLTDRTVPGGLDCNEHIHDCRAYTHEFSLKGPDAKRAQQFSDLITDSQASDAVMVTAEVQLLEGDSARLSLLLFVPDGSAAGAAFVTEHKAILQHLLHEHVTKPAVVASGRADMPAATRGDFSRLFAASERHIDHSATTLHGSIIDTSDPDLVVCEPGSELYDEFAHPYAASSYPPSESTPFLVMIPKTAEAVAKAVATAAALKKKVVAQSGGHQYSAKSTGGQDTIVVVMKEFHKITFTADKKMATVGVGTPLKQLSKTLSDNKLAVPHGECPYVNVGGHAQTGGFGHIMRSFGLFQDYIHSFKGEAPSFATQLPLTTLGGPH